MRLPPQNPHRRQCVLWWDTSTVNPVVVAAFKGSGPPLQLCRYSSSTHARSSLTSPSSRYLESQIDHFKSINSSLQRIKSQHGTTISRHRHGRECSTRCSETPPGRPRNQVESGNRPQSASFPAPLENSGTLDNYESFDVASVIGREFPKLQLSDILNDDAKIRDLAITGMFEGPS